MIRRERGMKRTARTPISNRCQWQESKLDYLLEKVVRYEEFRDIEDPDSPKWRYWDRKCQEWHARAVEAYQRYCR